MHVSSRLLLVLCSGIIGCDGAPRDAPPPHPGVLDALTSPEPAVESDTLAVQEAVLRRAFASTDTDLDPPAAYCVARTRWALMEGGDPGPALLERFAGSPVPVRPASACRIGAVVDPEDDWGRHSIVDRATGEYGLYVTIGAVQWQGPRRAEVEVGVLQGGLWGGGWRCVAEARGRQGWEITECRRTVDV